MINRQTVLRLIKEGKPNFAIAKELNCTQGTISRIKRQMADEGLLQEETLEDYDDQEHPDATEEELPQAVPTGSSKEAYHEAQSAKYRVIKARAELEMEKITREAAAMRGTGLLPGQPTPTGPPATDQAALLGVLLQGFQQLMAQMGELAARSSTPAPAPAPVAAPAPAPAQDLAALLPSLKSLIEFVGELRSDAEPQTPIESMIGAAAKAFNERTPAPQISPPQAVAQAQPTAPPATRAIFDHNHEGRKRAREFFGGIIRELQLRSDPLTVADTYQQRLGLLPEPLRQAILTQPIEGILGQLQNFLEPPGMQELVGAFQSTEAAGAWFEDLVMTWRDEPEELDTQATPRGLSEERDEVAPVGAVPALVTTPDSDNGEGI